MKEYRQLVAAAEKIGNINKANIISSFIKQKVLVLSFDTLANIN